MDNSYFNWKQKTYTAPQEKTLESRPGQEIPEGIPPLIRTKETGDKVYLVKEGIAHWITNPEVLKAVGGDWGQIKTIERGLFRQLHIAEKITVENAKEFTLTTDPQKPVHKIEASEVIPAPQNEFKQYDEPVIASAPKEEPEKGLTSIIIPVAWIHYPAFHYTGNCIGSIREHTDKEKTPYEIILIINGKTGITVDKLSQTYADKVVQLEENEGYAKAVNKGIRIAKGEYIAIVNNDVQVFDYWLEDLQEALRFDLNLVMATPMYGMPFARAVEATELRERSFRGVGRLIEDSFSDFTDFSCVLTRKKVFQEIGLFDEQFFMYGEDLDLLRRMKEAKMKYASTKRVNTSHIIGATSSGIDNMPEIMNESKAKLKAKWGY